MDMERLVDICFVVLNYNVFKETRECIQSIEERIDTENYRIILVDNHSEEEIYHKLSQWTKDDEKVILIRNAENLGFARGNNVGIEKARSYGPRFICCLNNDTVFIQNDFFGTLSNYYDQYHDGVIGPKVICRNGTIQEYHNKILSVLEYKSQIKRYEFELNQPRIVERLKNIGLLYWILHGLRMFLKTGRKKKINGNEQRENIILHGCCLIFTPEFFHKLQGFNPNTFLYREEEILYLSVISAGLTTRYIPQLCIKHLEDVSTKSVKIKRSEKNHFYIENQIRSIKVIIGILEEMENEQNKSFPFKTDFSQHI